MKKLSNTEAELKKNVAYKKAYSIINQRFSYSWPLLIISSHRIPPKQYYVLYSGHSPSASLGKGEGVEEESNKKTQKGEHAVKKWYPSHKFFYVHFSVIQSFLLDFSRSSDNITASNKDSISKKEPTSVSETTI